MTAEDLLGSIDRHMQMQSMAAEVGALDFLDFKQAAFYLRLSESALRQKYVEWGIPYVQVGKRILFKKSDLYTYLDDQRIIGQSEIEQRADEYINKRQK